MASYYATPVAYFDVAEDARRRPPSGRPKDRFHFTDDTARVPRPVASGVDVGYGIELAFLSAAPPRDVRVAYTEPGSPAAQAGIDRGMKMIEIDGVDVVNGTDVAHSTPASRRARRRDAHLQAAGARRQHAHRDADVRARHRTPVQNVKTFATASGPVGYLLFNDHIATGGSAADRGRQPASRRAGINDLVLDMRYNGGGFLDIASELAYMIATPAATTRHDLRAAAVQQQEPVPAHGGAGRPCPSMRRRAASRPRRASALPHLGLSRVTVLTGPDTCSASESVVNGLRGVGRQVNLIGGTTCGKPYGFYPQDNCGTTYFAIQFQGVNKQGFGDYGDGFAPTCAVAGRLRPCAGRPRRGPARRRAEHFAARAPARPRRRPGRQRARQGAGCGGCPT